MLSRREARAALLGMAVLVGVAGVARGQESVRMSLTSSQAAEARRKAATTLGYYNLKLGPTAWNFSTGLGLQYNDNIRYESDNPRQDLIVSPDIHARMLWPITERNSLNLNLGVGYSAYTSHSEFSRFFITPDTELSFDLYVGSVWINLHDRISILQDSYQDPTVVGVADYARLENAAGLTALWDLNKIVVRVGYDHLNYVNLQDSPGASPDGSSELFFTTAGYNIKPEMMAGLELGAGLIHYDQVDTNSVFTDATQWNVGSFFEAQVTEYLRGRASVGYTIFSPDSSSSADGDFNGVYAQLGVSHRVNQYLDYTLSGGRNVSFTFYGGTIDMYNVRWAANWHVLRKFILGTSFDYDHGSYLYGYNEEFDRFGPGISLSRNITKKLTGTLGYQFYWRESNLADRDYTVNLVTLGARYQF